MEHYPDKRRQPATWLEPDECWADPPPEAVGGFFLLKCPVCGFEYNHHGRVLLHPGHDAYKAWAGRGDCLQVSFWGECGHLWSLRFGFHKGNMFVYATCEGERMDDETEELSEEGT